MALPFGAPYSCYAMCSTTDAFLHILKLFNISSLCYVDDIAGCNISRHGAEVDFQMTCNLLGLLGLKLAAKKVVPPTTHATWLGVDFDTINMTMHIPKAKLTEVADSCAVLAHTTAVERQKWRSLLGTLHTYSHHSD
jgi:hypothetical protein